MGPKKNRKEKIRELKRQGDPNFNVPEPSSLTTSSQQVSRIPRPSILSSGHQSQTRQGLAAASVASTEPQSAKVASKSASTKGLRVTFDLSKNKNDSSENVAECWEDLSDDEAYDIDERDIIDVERELGDFGDEFDFGQSASNGKEAGHGSGKLNFFVGPRNIPSVNEIEDFSAVGGGDDGNDSDYDNVGTNDSYDFNNIEQDIRYFSDDSTEPSVSEAASVLSKIPEVSEEVSSEIIEDTIEHDFEPSVIKTNGNDFMKVNQIKINPLESNKIPFIDGTEHITRLDQPDTLPCIDGTKLIQLEQPDSNKLPCIDGTENIQLEQPGSNKLPCIDGTDHIQLEQPDSNELPFIDGTKHIQLEQSDSNEIPFIDGTTDTINGDAEDDDDEWETEQSGTSDESGKVYKIESFSHNIGVTTQQSQSKHPVLPILNSLEDDKTIADVPSICEDDSDIITNEDFDAAFHSVMKDDDELLPNDMIVTDSECAKMGDCKILPVDEKLNTQGTAVSFSIHQDKKIDAKSFENPSNLLEQMNENEESDISAITKIDLPQAMPELINASCLLESPIVKLSDNENLQSYDNKSDLPETENTLHEIHLASEKLLTDASKDNIKSEQFEIQNEIIIGPMEKPNNDRPSSPNVSVGFECKEGIPKSNGSETESEGELVIGEDKCVGTTDDLSDDECIDLSGSEKNSSPREDEMSESRDSLSLRSEDGNQSEKAHLARATDKQEAITNVEKEQLDVPVGNRIDTSPSPEIPPCTPLGKSESTKEKVKISNKSGKKKGKKNKLDGKLEQVPKTEVHPERPRLVRGKSWKDKKDKFITEHKDDLPLSFGNELCESEIVEGTSNLVSETVTEASLSTAGRCSPESTIATEKHCSMKETLPVEDIAKETEIKTGDENSSENPTVTVTQVLDTIEVPIRPVGDSGIYSKSDKDDFYVVKACEVAVPLEVLTEYVSDRESSEEINGLQVAANANTDSTHNALTMKENNIQPDFPVDSSSPHPSGDQNPVYSDAKDSSCKEEIEKSYDYVESFPSVIGTQNLNYYSYDIDTNCEYQSSGPKLTVKPLDSHMESNGLLVVDDDTGTPPLNSGEILYEGPCMCGPNSEREQLDGSMNVCLNTGEDRLCVPPNVDDNLVVGDETWALEVHKNMGSKDDSGHENCEEDSKDIRSRIKEIVGPRIHHKQSHHTGRRRGCDGDDPDAFHVDDNQLFLDPENKVGDGRDESPMPGSSPTSSSGVQGSDEMSPSRSHSCSPSREASVSPPSTTDNVSDIAYDTYQVHTSPIKVSDEYSRETKGAVPDGCMELSPEKEGSQVDYSFKTFRDMYQINPVYTTDSEDDLQESDTVVQSSSGLSYDPDRSITVSSGDCLGWGSTSEESPAPVDPSRSPPLPIRGRGTKKVPKVTRQLKETQGIVQRWEVLQAQAVERQRQSSQVRELQRQVKNLRLALENLAEQSSDTSQNESVGDHQQLQNKLQEAKARLEEVRARKTEVSSLNLAVHRFFTDSGYTLAQLKDEVNDLYILYDEAHRKATNEVSRLEGLEATWKLWESEAEELTRALRQDGDTLKVLDAAIQTGSLTDSVTASMQDVARLLNDRRKGQQPGGKKLSLQHTRTQGVDIQGSTLSLGTSGDDCLSDSGTSGYESCSSEELSERERRLAHLRRLARDLEASLSPDSQAWLAITKTLSTAENELKGLQKHCRDLVVRSTETLDQTKASPQLRRRSWAKDTKVGRVSSRVDKQRNGSSRDSGRGNGRRGWMWRVVRAALPFQAALLLLFCVACLLEPNCCDTHNSLTMTLTPQLRYVHGPPPV